MEEDKLVHEILDEHFTMHFGRRKKMFMKGINTLKVSTLDQKW
jgi:hypothetical protein